MINIKAISYYWDLIELRLCKALALVSVLKNKVAVEVLCLKQIEPEFGFSFQVYCCVGIVVSTKNYNWKMSSVLFLDIMWYIVKLLYCSQHLMSFVRTHLFILRALVATTVLKGTYYFHFETVFDHIPADQTVARSTTENFLLLFVRVTL